MLGSLYTWVAQSLEVARSRRQLAALDLRALEDLGLTEADIATECSRPFWDREPRGRRDCRTGTRRPYGRHVPS